MELAEFALLLSRLATGAIATFFAILLWSQTRFTPTCVGTTRPGHAPAGGTAVHPHVRGDHSGNGAWVLVIIGTLVSYAEIVFTTLEIFGVISADFFYVSGFPVFEMVLVNLPLVFLTLAFISMIVRKRLR